MDFHLETVALSDLKPHPRNYLVHPADEIAHLVQSIQENGFYRNIVVASDLTILAGHGVVQACQQIGLTEIPVYRLNISPTDQRALKVLTGDNEIPHLAERNDRLLSELLKEIKDFDESNLIGTGYDEQVLANLVFVTRPRSEIATHDAASEWLGLPAYEAKGSAPEFRLIVSFRNAEDRAAFGQVIGVPLTEATKSVWYPHKPTDDTASIEFVG